MSQRTTVHIAAVATGILIGVCRVCRAEADAVTQRMEKLEQQVSQLTADRSPGPLWNGVQIHGYGEAHYNNLSGDGGAADKEETDLHRFVMFFGYDFNDRIRFNSELEIEHAFSGPDKPGEVEMEQAYLDFDLTERHLARAGLFLVPVGLMNQTHEPPRFYGVERNPVENQILPTTWREIGAGLQGDLGAGWGYEAYLHSGLNTSTGSTYGVRAGRQNGAGAKASDPAATLALKWNAAGVVVGGAVQYQSDITQSGDPEAGSAWLGELHADLRRGPMGLRALYAEWTLNGDGPESMDADRQYGWYLEPSYRITEALGLFARYNEWDNQAGAGATVSGKRQWDAGVNWWPHEQVVAKVDYQWQDNESGRNQNGVNLGLGYEF